MIVPLTVVDHIDRAETVFPSRVAAVDEPGGPGSLGRITYGSLAARARGLALGLDAMGVAEGDRVAICSPNSTRMLISLFGVSAYGRVLVPVNFRLNAEEVGYIIEHSGAQVLLVDPEMADALAGVAVKERVLLDGTDDAELFAEAPDGATPAFRAADENGTASINYTSGTTARPKGVQLTHRNLWLNAATFGWHTGVSDRDVYLHTLPLFHCNGWGMPYALSAMGARHVLLRKVDGEEILKRIETEGVTLLCGAPAVAAAILDAAARRTEQGRTVPGGRPQAADGRRDGQHVRIVLAGAPPPSRTIERIEAELGWEFIQIYGLTETAPLLTVNRAGLEDDELSGSDRARKLSRAGVPALGIRMAVDEQGEVLARGNHIFAGYWEQPEETAEALDGGWFHTGDGGRVDGSFVVISDRKKDVIISGGENVSSIEVEDCLYGHPAVAEVAVIGVPDEKWGETVKALIVVRAGAQAPGAEELREFCRDRMAHFKCPTSFELVDSLPRTATGKLQKFKLRQSFWEGRDRRVN